MKVHFFHSHNNALALYRMWQPAENCGLDVERMSDGDLWWKKSIGWLDEVRQKTDLLFFQYKPNMLPEPTPLLSRRPARPQTEPSSSIWGNRPATRTTVTILGNMDETNQRLR